MKLSYVNNKAMQKFDEIERRNKLAQNMSFKI